jgi:hypothetical protein
VPSACECDGESAFCEKTRVCPGQHGRDEAIVDILCVFRKREPDTCGTESGEPVSFFHVESAPGETKNGSTGSSCTSSPWQRCEPDSCPHLLASSARVGEDALEASEEHDEHESSKSANQRGVLHDGCGGCGGCGDCDVLHDGCDVLHDGCDVLHDGCGGCDVLHDDCDGCGGCDVLRDGCDVLGSSTLCEDTSFSQHPTFSPHNDAMLGAATCDRDAKLDASNSSSRHQTISRHNDAKPFEASFGLYGSSFPVCCCDASSTRHQP